jgi:hypothetical protein
MYLSSPYAMSNIYGFNRGARIIAMLRNPVDLVYSFHSQCLINLIEDERDFEAAWRLQQLREKGNRIPALCKYPEFIQYSKIGMLGKQIERLLSYFHEEQVKIIFYEDFVRSPRQVYSDVLSFLAVPDDGRLDFPRINANRIYRSRFIAQMRRGQPWQRCARALKKMLGIREFALLSRLNIKELPRKPLSPGFRAELQDTFSEDIAKLSILINRDLSHWISGMQQ